jgi:SNF2 family DNA or RNA helicase
VTAKRLYGELALAEESGTWRLKAEPHVLIRVKRLFPRVAAERVGVVTIKDSDEVRRDLFWILDRYPLVITARDWARLAEGSRLYDERSRVFDGILTGKLEPRDFELALPPREYQKVAADLALRMGGLLVADDLGLGKTVTAICMLTDKRTRPALVVTLTHLPKQWDREIKKFAPSLRTHIIKKGSPYDVRNKAGKFPDVLIVNYHKLNGWAQSLGGVMKAVVFDEAQELRRDASAKYEAAQHIATGAKYRMGLSATPIYGYGSEFYNVLSVIQPDSLGSKSEFVREWCRGVLDQNGRGRIDDPKAFGAFVRDAGLMIRRTRRDAGRELPRLSKISHYVDSDTKALDDAKSGVMALAKMIVARSGTSFDRMKAGGELDWKMRQATGIAKAPYVAEFVKMLVEAGEKVLLYGWHHAVYSVWMERFAEDTRSVLYTGQESVAQKDQALKAFIEGDAQVLIMSLRAGQGIDGIQKSCRTVVFGELDWSPGVMEQCIGRAFRDGQTDPVAAYFLIADEGSDPVIADVLGLKKAQIEGVRDPEAELTEQVGAAPEDGIRRLAESVLAARQKDGDEDASEVAIDNLSDT